MKRLNLLLILLFCGLLSAQLQWQEGGIPVNVNYPLYWYNSGGNVIEEITYFIWSESNSGNPDLYLQGYDETGNQVWAEHLLICDAPKYQGRGEVIAAENGNIIAAWQDTRNRPGLYFGEGYEIYLQKISPEGEFLWDEEVVIPEICNAYDFNLLADNSGGCYISFNAITWHLDEEGELYPGWEDGIIISDNYYSFSQIVDSAGNLVVNFNEEDSSYITKISPTGEFLWFHLQVADFYINTDYIFTSENSITIISRNAYSIYMQYISENGIAWDEPLEIFTGNSYITDLIADEHSNGYYLLSCEYDAGWSMFNITSDGEIVWNDPLTCGGGIDGIHTLLNDNFRIWRRDSSGFTLWEFGNDAEMISPEEGWFQVDLPDYSWNNIITAFAGDNSTAIGYRYCPAESAEEILQFQIIDELGQPVCADDFSEISAGSNDWKLVDGVFKVNEYEVVTLRSSNSYDYVLSIKIFDEDGNQIGDSMPISSENVKYAHPLQIIGNRLYFANEVEVDFDSYLYINAVDFSDDPQLVWGTDGLFLGEGAFINNDINITQPGDDEDILLFTWTQECPYGNTQMQKMVDDEFVWQSGGITFPCQNGQLHRVYAYQDYILQMISWGNGYYLNRVDDNGNPLWDNEILLAGDLCAGKPVAIPQTNGNMHFYRGQYITDGLALVEHRITPEGEELSGEQGDIICFLNEEFNIQIIPLENSFAVITQSGDGYVHNDIHFRRFDFTGAQTGEMIELEHESYTEINNIDFVNENLAVTYSSGYGSGNLQVVDFEGVPCELLPENPYVYIELSNYPVPTYTCQQDNDLYFCWVDCYTSERPDEGEYGWSWYMQKVTIPVVGCNETEILPQNILKLYPNPFNPELKIEFAAFEITENTEINIYNIKGQCLRKWKINNGRESIVWDGRNESGDMVGSGVYLIKLRNDTGCSLQKKVTLIK